MPAQRKLSSQANTKIPRMAPDDKHIFACLKTDLGVNFVNLAVRTARLRIRGVYAAAAARRGSVPNKSCSTSRYVLALSRREK